MDYARADRADALAAQYVAGTLRGPARRRFEALLPGHPALRAAVRRWQDALVPLAAVVPPVAPPASAWAGIERRLGFSPAVDAAAAPRAGWWRSLALWRGVAALGFVASVGMATLLSSDGAGQAPVVVVLQATGAAGAPGAGAAYVASFSADGRALVTRPVQPVALTPQQVLELWAVPPQGAPRSLGLIKADGL
ncbi:MAG: anti-sigma factor domain-containing protein, partial [Aquabacterium sp.]